ncbi:hypothetical protein Alg130_11599 [Pyrenophora tritici-repentis]|uniref:Uncharacterized protein n=1 Tax=Pyrenophora tritici-repentis (strain Pt-1C-BFP) TaxID=426418 RepID=B2WEP8_PYRTR|nr:uncharacterized protein PTRG_08621 [Pyrenophora tritici-repentis Pt-1C-BFP]EDU51540.1 predicted protein [Pyrenophora tritici-repentis Pt-1C-BFP]KAI0569547.1 hypothetical protein Alg130_11599 [Pyrenophora tritici-repentis]KAI0571559.1 hypothetical protein Alg215_10318 [Pyrenophora tritici-repentis]
MLQALLDGTLPQKVEVGDQSHSRLRAYFDDALFDDYLKAVSTKSRPPPISTWALRSKGNNSPAFYVRCFISDIGDSPTPRQFRTIIACTRQYISGDPDHAKLCLRIDNESRANRSDEEDITHGRHYFLAGSARGVEIIATFCGALEGLLNEGDDHTQDIPFPHMFKYIKYTEKEGAHNKPIFKWKTYVIGYPISVDECKLGKELFARLTESYFNSDIGFNIAPAGLSLSRMEKLVQERKQRVENLTRDERTKDGKIEKAIQDLRAVQRQTQDMCTDPEMRAAKVRHDEAFWERMTATQKDIQEQEKDIQEQEEAIERE